MESQKFSQTLYNVFIKFPSFKIFSFTFYNKFDENYQIFLVKKLSVVWKRQDFFQIFLNKNGAFHVLTVTDRNRNRKNIYDFTP